MSTRRVRVFAAAPPAVTVDGEPVATVEEVPGEHVAYLTQPGDVAVDGGPFEVQRVVGPIPELRRTAPLAAPAAAVVVDEPAVAPAAPATRRTYPRLTAALAGAVAGGLVQVAARLIH